MVEINTRYLVSNLTQQTYSKGVGVEAIVIGEQGLLRNKLATHNAETFCKMHLTVKCV